jgi:hypothetical protein
MLRRIWEGLFRAEPGDSVGESRAEILPLREEGADGVFAGETVLVVKREGDEPRCPWCDDD